MQEAGGFEHSEEGKGLEGRRGIKEGKPSTLSFSFAAEKEQKWNTNSNRGRSSRSTGILMQCASGNVY